MNFITLTGPDNKDVVVNLDRVDVFYAKHEKGAFKLTELLIGDDLIISVRETPEEIVARIKGGDLWAHRSRPCLTTKPKP